MDDYTGSSVVDYLKSVGQPADFNSRAALAASKGIQGYTGTAQQNLQLINTLRGSAAPAGPQSAPATPQSVPTTPGATPSTGQVSEQQLIAAMTQKGHTPDSARAAIAGRGVADLAREYLGTSATPSGVPTGTPSGSTEASGSMGAGIPTLTPQPTINLPQLYERLYASSGIKDLEADLSAKEKEFIEAKGKVNDNPFLSEATRVGREATLQKLFDERTANQRNDIATRKADIETQLNIQMKQFDIDSAQAKQALSQFSVLLEAGALNGASGEDIANITRSTGLSSSMIEGAIEQQKLKNVEVREYDDGQTKGYITIDKSTGEILKKQSLGQSTGGQGTDLLGSLESIFGAMASGQPEAALSADQMAFLQEWESEIQTIVPPEPVDISKKVDLSQVDLSKVDLSALAKFDPMLAGSATAGASARLR